MAEITITGKKALRTIRKEFQEQFPYLGLSFLTPEEWNKARSNTPSVHPLPDDKRLSEVRTVPPPRDEKEFSIHGRTLVKNLEDNFLNKFGLYVLVTYQKGGTVYYTSGDNDKLSLTQLNKKLEEQGYTKKPANAHKA